MSSVSATTEDSSPQSSHGQESTAPDAKTASTDGVPLVSVMAYAFKILTTPDNDTKARLTLEAEMMWQAGQLPLRSDQFTYREPPLYSARPADLNTVNPLDVKSRGKGGSAAKRIAMVHSLAHIESFAIDLSWDILYRFDKANPAWSQSHNTGGVEMPDEFVEDWLRIAAEEARHYSTWAHRLKQMESHYGALPVHNSLWDSAVETHEHILARLAIVHMVHEARGLDVTPQTINRFKSGGDDQSAALMEGIYLDEITHVTSGMRWFSYVCERLQQEPAFVREAPSEDKELDEKNESSTSKVTVQHTNPSKLDPIAIFHATVRKYFRGSLKPPFNTEAREKAGFTPEWYMPLVSDKERKSQQEREHKQQQKSQSQKPKQKHKQKQQQPTQQEPQLKQQHPEQ